MAATLGRAIHLEEFYTGCLCESRTMINVPRMSMDSEYDKATRRALSSEAASAIRQEETRAIAIEIIQCDPARNKSALKEDYIDAVEAIIARHLCGVSRAETD